MRIQGESSPGRPPGTPHQTVARYARGLLRGPDSVRDCARDIDAPVDVALGCPTPRVCAADSEPQAGPLREVAFADAELEAAVECASVVDDPGRL